MRSGSHEALDGSDAESRCFERTSNGGRELRELTLDSLRRANGPLPLAEVACRVVAADGDHDTPEIRRDEVQRVYLALVRDQIPRLERRGVVDYSEDDGMVELAGPGTP